MTERIVLRGSDARRQISRMRLLAQRLAPVTAGTPHEVVRWLTCLQAQDFRSARSAVALRAGAAVEAVDAAIGDGAIVRSWPMRGTLHLVDAADLRWMLALTADSTLRTARRRREQLEITGADVDHALSVVTQTLRGGRGATRAQVFEAWNAEGIATAGQRGVHLLETLCLRTELVLGPISGRHQQFVLFDEWIRCSNPVDRVANVANWATRYFRSHGPATLADFHWWSGLLRRDLAPVWDTVRAGLAEVVAGDTSYFLAPETLGAWDEHRGATLRPVLTPAFDEILLGYADRTPTLDREHSGRVVPGGNGMFKATLIDGGQAVATWRRAQTKGTAGIEVSQFDGLSRRAERVIPGLVARYPFASR
ncbi:winged helix DNA-binding domain-containing protein [Flexivirga caeni]|uniref:Winged helix DNA-binding domain-containing protein n=1 Tax=Flexivirga caeni TaxID=2294115 RepID=A0A3M9MI59_9MICO|nr:winged helix DNA-binding domain-containing protein [Flexivirga caeni]RNI24348.1 winged helix DNA-binding domain-containing protein [Flexivirga caeni]